MNLKPRDIMHAEAAVQKHGQPNTTSRHGDAVWWWKMGKVLRIAGTREKASSKTAAFTCRSREETAVILQEPASIDLGRG